MDVSTFPAPETREVYRKEFDTFVVVVKLLRYTLTNGDEVHCLQGTARRRLNWNQGEVPCAGECFAHSCISAEDAELRLQAKVKEVVEILAGKLSNEFLSGLAFEWWKMIS